MNKPAKFFLAIIIGSVIAAGVAFYFNLKKAIRIEHVTMDATSISQDTVEVEVNMLIDNPFFFDFMLKDIWYQASLGKKQVLDDSTMVNQEITDSTSLQIPITLNYNKIRTQLEALQPQDSTMLDFTFDVSYELPVIGLQRTSIGHAMKVPVPKLVSLEVQEIDVKSFGFQNIDLSVNMLLHNPNKTEAVINDLIFNVSLNESTLVEGARARPIDIEPKEKVYFNLPVSVKTGSIAKEFFDKITKGDKINVFLDGSCILKLEGAPVDSIRIKFDTEGAMEL